MNNFTYHSPFTIHHSPFTKFSFFFLVSGFCLPDVFGQSVKVIELQNANALEFDKDAGKNVKHLIGNVVFKHEDALMYCDSAYLYSDENRLDAFGHVHINKSDSVHIYGDMLNYDGNTRLADIHQNVKMESEDFNLKGNNLSYDMKNSRAHYNDGATIDDIRNGSTIKSRRGVYFSATRFFFFRDSVRVNHPEYTISTDSLRYSPETKISYFIGPTTIVSDTNRIYCEKGWYDTQHDIAMFRNHAKIHSGKQFLKADSIYYERKKGRGEAFMNVEFVDTVEDIIISGNYCRYEGNFSTSVVTDSALLILAFEDDSLFLHSDSIRAKQDTASGQNTFYAYRHVKFFKSDLQGICDSVVYSERDSLIWLFKDPVLWSDENQLTGDSIRIMMFQSQIHSLWLDNNAFIVAKIMLDSSGTDSSGYNQIEGKKMKGHFIDNRLRKIDVKGNGKTIYYIQDEHDAFVGINKTECTDMIIYMTDSSGTDENAGSDKKGEQKIEKITFLAKPDAILYPMAELKGEDLFLKKFVWQGVKRPASKMEIF